MSDYIQTSNMSLTVPISGVALGPDWANELNACLVIVDSHDHSSGKGVSVTPSGLNINADLPFGGNNATTVRTVQFSNPNSQPSGASDVNCVYAYQGNLYYNNGGFAVQITNGHSISGTPGSIANLSSPASATYVSLSSTFVWQSDANAPANMDGASYILRNLSANSKGLTLSPPAAMPADYTITLPALPGSGTSLVTLSSAGAMGTTAPDGTTIVNTGSVLKVADGGITNTQVVGGFGLIPTGAIIDFGGTVAPNGYLLCDGASYLRTDYAALFTAIGTAFGAADGTHFNVPIGQGYFRRGVSGSTSNDPDRASRTAMATGGNTGNNVGSVQSYQIQSHAHTTQGAVPGAGFSSASTLMVISDATGTTPSSTSGLAGGNETRPLNYYTNSIIKT